MTNLTEVGLVPVLKLFDSIDSSQWRKRLGNLLPEPEGLKKGAVNVLLY